MNNKIPADTPELFRDELESTLNALDQHNATMRAIERALSIPTGECAPMITLDLNAWMQARK